MLAATDTLDIYNRLKKSFTEKQAHELSQMFVLIDSGASINGSSAKKNVTELEVTMRNGFKEQEAHIKELDLKIEATQHNIKELDLKIEATQHNVKELELQIVRTQTEMVSAIGNSKVEIIKWVVGLFFLQVSMLVGLLAAYVGMAV